MAFICGAYGASVVENRISKLVSRRSKSLETDSLFLHVISGSVSAAGMIFEFPPFLTFQKNHLPVGL